MIPDVLSIDQALQALPVRKSRRWLVSFLHRTPTDPAGRPLYRLMGRDKLIYLDRLIEALPCPSRSPRPATRRRRASTSGAATLASQLTRVRELTSSPSPRKSSNASRAKSSGENTGRKLELIVSNRHS